MTETPTSLTELALGALRSPTMTTNQNSKATEIGARKRFQLDGHAGIYEGIADEKWNGWESPLFHGKVVEQLAADLGLRFSHSRYGVIRLQGDEIDETFTPTPLGLYDFTGWCFVEATR